MTTFKKGDRFFSHYTFKFGTILDDAETEHWGEAKTARRKESWDGWHHVEHDDGTTSTLDASRMMPEKAGRKWIVKHAPSWNPDFTITYFVCADCDATFSDTNPTAEEHHCPRCGGGIHAPLITQ